MVKCLCLVASGARKGQRCRYNAQTGSKYCKIHESCKKDAAKPVAAKPAKPIVKPVGAKPTKPTVKPATKPKKVPVVTPQLIKACQGKTKKQGGMNMPEIIALAKKHGVPHTGTRKSVLARLCAATETPPPLPPPVPIPAPVTEKPSIVSKTQCKKWLSKPGYHPVTGKKIKTGSPAFKKFQKACVDHGIAIPDHDNVTEASFRSTYKCDNAEDVISGDVFYDLDDYDDIITLSSGQCYDIDSIYGWYKSNVESSSKTTDPITRDELTKADIALINKYMKDRDPNYVPPKHIVIGPPTGYTFAIEQFPALYQGYHYIYMMHGAQRINLGMIPVFVTSGHTGSVDYTSPVLMATLAEAWHAGVLLENNDPAQLTGIRILMQTRNGDSAKWHPQNLPVLYEELRTLIDTLKERLGR